MYPILKQTSLEEFDEIVIGIDPGVNGGIAILHTDGRVHDLVKMPPTEKDILDLFWEYNAHQGVINATLEQLWGRPDMGGASMFKLGANVGFLRASVMCAGMRLHEIPPQRWQKELGVHRDKGDTDTAWKNKLKALAQKLFPDMKVTLWGADALLIAEYCRRMHGREQRKAA